MKVSGIIFTLLLITSSTSAQIERKTESIKADTENITDSNNAGNNQGRKELMQELGLTKEQRSKFRELMQSNRAAKEAIENNMVLTVVEKKTKMRDLQKTQLQQIRTVLTPEQFEKFKQSMMIKRRDSRQNNQ